MKHAHLRRDQTCLNCGAIVPERFCSHCGQENTEPQESFGHLLGHFFADVTHYDSQFFKTLKDLIIRPGFLTLQYNSGKRLSYLNPIRMYIFISAIFFLVMFSQKKEGNESNPVTNTREVNWYRQHLADSLRELKHDIPGTSSSARIRIDLYAQLADHLDTLKVAAKKDVSLTVAFDGDGNVVFKMDEGKYTRIAQYDSVQSKLADTAKDGSVLRYMVRKIIRLNKERRHNGELVVKQNVAHDIPKIMFILLPLFALFVSMLYGLYNKRKYLYSQHAIFTLHFHSFVFIAFLVLYLLSLTVISLRGWLIFDGIISAIVFIYLVAALHTAYNEKVWLSFIKAVTITVLYAVTLIITMCVIFAVTFIAL
jgi:hypothetical protein